MDIRIKLRIKPKYLNYIESGDKTAEGRLAFPDLRNLRIGEPIVLFNHEKLLVRNVDYLVVARNFEAVLNFVYYKLLIPDAQSEQDAVNLYNSFYSMAKQERVGAIVIGLTDPNSNLNNTDTRK